MIEGYHPVVQALMGTFVTWGFTALGSAMVFVLDVEDKQTSQKILDGMLGFAGGVMLAASYWSLLAPSIEIAAESELYGPDGRWSFVPAAVGFTLGALTLFGTEQDKPSAARTSSFRRVLLLVIAITLHNLPEGMAVGVGFGSVGHSSSASFANAVNLAIGIGLQNFPEGLAVSMPLRREGTSAFRAFMWGQASGLVEPIGGLIGAGAVLYVQPILPYALSFAAGAMIFVVVDDLIPETTQSGNQKLATFGTIVGFVVMMVMDVALG
uniref:Zinc transporter ZIP11 n=1 Tax=Phytophthora ramorum TaxID=164328 RepID=H3G8M3_PHYRM